MMYYKLSPQYALRKWKNTGAVLYNLTSRQLMGLDFLSSMTLSQCDGATPCDPDDETVKRLVQQGIISPCESSSEIAEEQKYKVYPNEYFPIVQWAITNRCNYKCKHCFMASSVHDESAEPTHQQCMDIIDQLHECGIRNIYITGGEPLLRNDFLSIIDKLIQNGINIDIISTNGSLVNDELLRGLQQRGVKCAFAISFDGIGRHDWLRGVPGAEQASVRAVELLVSYDFPVIMEMAVHKGNADVVIETASMAHSLGVGNFKTIRVGESPRWKVHGNENNLTPEQYYDTSLELLKTHIQQGWQMDMKLIGFIYYYYATKHCDILPMKGLSTDTDNTVLCKKARSILFISGDGRLLPCNPFNGMTAGTENWGNIYTTPLRDLLTQSPYLDKVNARVHMLKQHDQKCRDCQWFKYCLGGCRACAYMTSHDYLSADLTKCAFFEGGYVDKIREIVQNCTQDF